MTEKLKQDFVTGWPLNLRRLLFLAVVLVFAMANAVLKYEVKAATPKIAANAEKNAAAESRWTKLDSAKIHYVNYGKGDEALVLVHGWTQNVDGWRDQAPDFAKRNRVIVVDLPGHGQSDKPQTTYSMDYFARAVDAVMRDAKVKRAVLVGHSMGTPVARQFYRKYPEKTIAIVVVDGALRPFGDKALMDRMIAGFRSPNFREAAQPMFVAMSGPNLQSETKDRITASFMNTPQHVVVSAMEGMADASIWGEDKITVPVLAVMAKNQFYPPNVEESFRGIAPTMEFYMWDGVGHFLMMEKPKEFNAAVVAFLNKNRLLVK
jgi:pimeloyl-ACP methyl ester carboxylesterase